MLMGNGSLILFSDKAGFSFNSLQCKWKLEIGNRNLILFGYIKTDFSINFL